MKLTELSVGQDELDEIQKVFESGYLTQGLKTSEFEDRVKKFTKSKWAHATSSATTGLHLSLVAIGVGAGDEVIIPDFSFPATANVIEQLGATPIFVDISLDTFNVDATKIATALSPRTKAIMPVHAFGLCAEMDTIKDIADNYSIDVVEDAACALGATYKGVSAGKFGRLGVFSFHPRKIITTGEGGMIITDDDEMSERLSLLRSHGAIRLDHYLQFEEIGFNYRLSDINSAIGVVQMKKIQAVLTGRRHAAMAYSMRLSGIDGVSVPSEPIDHLHSYQSYVIILSRPINRDKVIRLMRDAGVETTLGTYAMHLQPVFRRRYGLSDADFPNASHAHRQCLTLPLGHSMTNVEIDFVCDNLLNAIKLSRDDHKANYMSG